MQGVVGLLNGPDRRRDWIRRENHALSWDVRKCRFRPVPSATHCGFLGNRGFGRGRVLNPDLANWLQAVLGSTCGDDGLSRLPSEPVWGENHWSPAFASLMAVGRPTYSVSGDGRVVLNSQGRFDERRTRSY